MYELKTLFFEITKKCNARCEHCGSRCDIDEPEGISGDMFKSVLLDVKQNIGSDNVMVNITGGEPLLRKDLFDIMGYAHNELGFEWGMVTNGTLITNDIIKKMKQSGMATISISLDGMQKTHEEFRHLPNSFNKILNNIIKLIDANFLDHIQVTFIANKKNIHELPALWRLLNNMGITSMRISSIDPIGRAEDNKDLMLDTNDFKYLFKFIDNTNKKNELPCVWSCSHYFGNTDISPDELGRHFQCQTGKNVGSILSDGSIFVCPNVPRLPELIQGNIKTDKFSDVWKNGFKPFRKRKLNNTCEQCQNKEFCNGDSFHTWDFEANKPKFCYKKMFNNTRNENKEISIEQYISSIKKKYEKSDIIIQEVNSNNKEKTDNVYIDPEAYEQIKSYFNIGKKHPSSMYEQQMALIGYKTGNNFIVRYAVPSFMENRTRNMGCVNKNTITNAIEEAEIINENFFLSDDSNDIYKGEFRLLGFIHSHPMDVNFAFSDGDSLFHSMVHNIIGENISILVNPQNENIAAFSELNMKQINLKIIEKKKT